MRRKEKKKEREEGRKAMEDVTEANEIKAKQSKAKKRGACVSFVVQSEVVRVCE